MTQDIIFSDATRLAELIRTRQIAPVEVVQAHLDRIAAVDPKINPIVTVAEGALAAAREAEAAVMAGRELGPLHGVPFTAKDSIDTAGVMTRRGSPIFKGRLPDIGATSVARVGWRVGPGFGPIDTAVAATVRAAAEAFRWRRLPIPD